MHYSDYVRLAIMLIAGFDLCLWVRLAASIRMFNHTITFFRFITRFANLFTWILICVTFILAQISKYGQPLTWPVYLVLACAICMIPACWGYSRIIGDQLKELLKENAMSLHSLAKRQMEELRIDSEELIRNSKINKK